VLALRPSPPGFPPRRARTRSMTRTSVTLTGTPCARQLFVTQPTSASPVRMPTTTQPPTDRPSPATGPMSNTWSDGRP
jgi:hypothetical protein